MRDFNPTTSLQPDLALLYHYSAPRGAIQHCGGQLSFVEVGDNGALIIVLASVFGTGGPSYYWGCLDPKTCRALVSDVDVRVCSVTHFAVANT